MSTILGNLPPILGASRRISHSRRLCFFKPLWLTMGSSNRSMAVRAAGAVRASVVEAMPEASKEADTEEKLEPGLDGSKSRKVLGCPVCYEPLTWSRDDSSATLSLESVQGTTLKCNSCKKAYYADKAYFDLTIAAAAKDYTEPVALVTQFFSTQSISSIYERGWRQGFGLGGYPGPEKEFEMAKQYLEPVLGGNIVDASCGSGLFSRKFANSGLFSFVVALDYSANMLQQCYEFANAEQDASSLKEKLILVRADIARLPFVSASVDAVHAGAALHCWPSPSAAVAEISRVLKPGGIFVATTTLADVLPSPFLPFVRPLRENLVQFSGSRLFLSESELQDLCRSCGLVGFTCQRNGPFIMMSASKPK